MDVVERVADVLGGRAVLGRSIRSWSDLDRAVRDGLPKRSLHLVARRVAPPGTAASAIVYGVVPPATFKRRVRLSAEESARTERLARVIALADAMWGTADEARSFLHRPHPLLEGESPLAAARTELGARRVERLLADVEHGLPL